MIRGVLLAYHGSRGPCGSPTPQMMTVRALSRESKSWSLGSASWRSIDATPLVELRAHERAIIGRNPDEEHRPFDLGMTTGEGLSLSNVANHRALAALRAIRFVEVVGSPSSVSGDLLSRAARALWPYSQEWTSALAVRSAKGGADKGFSKAMSRWRIAFMAPELARSLAESQRRTIELALEQVTRSTGAVQTWWFWSERLEAAMEALSRFVLRLKPEKVESVLQLARSLYSDPLIRPARPVFPALGKSPAQVVGSSSRFLQGGTCTGLAQPSDRRRRRLYC